MKYELLLLIGGILVTHAFGIGMVLNLVGAALLYAFLCGIWMIFIEPLFYCRICDKHHVFGVNMCKKKHGLEK